jgi:hypothetical protein
MGIEQDRRNTERLNSDTTPALGDQGGTDGAGNSRELKDLKGPPIDRVAEQKKLSGSGEGGETVKELRDVSGPSIDRASEQQRNRELWKK